MQPCSLCHGVGIAYVNKKDDRDGMEYCPKCNGTSILLEPTTEPETSTTDGEEISGFQVFIQLAGMLFILGSVGFWLILGGLIVLSYLYKLVVIYF